MDTRIALAPLASKETTLMEARYSMDESLNPCAATARRMLWLGRGDLVALGGDRSDLYMEALQQGFALHAAGQFVQPLKPYLRWPGADHIADRIIAMPAWIGGDDPIAGLKWVGSRQHNPARFGLARASATIILNHPQTNHPIAIMEGGLISAMRTAAVTGVAARYLARAGFTDVALIGCGPIARAQAGTLLEQFTSIRRLHLYDLCSEAAEQLAATLRRRFSAVDYRPAESAEAAIRAADVVIPCTVTDKPYIRFDWLRPGAFVSNISIMDVHKEVFLKADKVVVDDWDQANREGKVIHQLVQEGLFTREALHAQMGEIVTGRRPGRESEDEVILLNPMGMAVDDIVCAQAIYRKACEADIGTWLDLY